MSCLICERIEMIKNESNPYFVKELETGYVVIGDHQRFKGYTLFLCKNHQVELHHLERDFKVKYLEEMSIVAEAVANAFEAEKMNIELLGNGDAHLHFHLFPRKDKDTPTKGPVWWIPRTEMFNDNNRPDSQELENLKSKLNQQLERLVK